MAKGFSSPRSDAFPAGLRVLVVDDDPTWLRILEKMLKKCSYEVTTCGLATDALRLLRGQKDGFDIVVSDVNMPDMDGFKLLERVGLEMDLPVVMMSVDGETSRVMKGVQHGACDYLLKPIRMKELKNIWQHVLRKKIHETRDIGSSESDPSDEDQSSARKRKDAEEKLGEKDYYGEACSGKKARVVWSVELHQRFVKAVNQIGFDKVGPKKILDLMNVPWLTRENVASHLQKYRLYLIRLQKEKENDSKPFCGGAEVSDAAPEEPPGRFGLQISTNIHQNVAALLPRIDDLKGVASVSSKTGFGHSFKPLEHESSFGEFSSSVWTKASLGEESEIQFRQEHTPPLLLHLENSFDPTQSIPSNSLKHSVKSTKPLYPEFGSNIHTNTASILLGGGSSIAAFSDDLRVLFPGDCNGNFLEVLNVGLSDYIDPVLASDFPNHSRDSLMFGSEYYDPAESAIIDQSMMA